MPDLPPPWCLAVLVVVLVRESEPSYSMEDMLSTIADKTAERVGRAVKARRNEMKLTLRALATRSGISPSMISDIERGEKSPTISTMAQIAAALGVPLPALLEACEPQCIRVVRAATMQVFTDPATGAKRQSFGPAVPGSKVEFLRYVVPPRVTAGPFAAHPSGTIEHVHVGAGAIRVVVGDEASKLETGDSCSCFADASHFFDNADGDVEALIYLVVEQH
jgi:transcriptional regulator with XRE-family HTH domain